MKALKVAALLMMCVVAVVIGWWVMIHRPRDRQVNHQFLPGPQGIILHLKRESQNKFAGWGSGQPTGLPGPRYVETLIDSEFRFRASAAEKEETWKGLTVTCNRQLFLVEKERLIDWIMDFRVDQEGRIHMAVRTVPIPRCDGSILLPVRQDTDFTPDTFRSSFSPATMLNSDLPIWNFNQPSGFSITPFGALETEDGHIVSHEWHPDEIGCFTQWWEDGRWDTFRYSRFRPPFEADRIDRRTSFFSSQEKQTFRRWSGHAFLYRQEQLVTGIYWPGLQYQPSGQGKTPVLFVHVFGHYDDSQATVTRLTAIDENGGVWVFDDIGAHFSVRGQLLYYTHDQTRLPQEPNDWLRYRVTGIDQLLLSGHPEGELQKP